jgi:hypothetical protein
MDNNQIEHDLAVAYAKVKLQEFEISNREALAVGFTDMQNIEIQYLKKAYDFAIKNLSE